MTKGILRHVPIHHQPQRGQQQLQLLPQQLLQQQDSHVLLTTNIMALTVTSMLMRRSLGMKLRPSVMLREVILPLFMTRTPMPSLLHSPLATPGLGDADWRLVRTSGAGLMAQSGATPTAINHGGVGKWDDGMNGQGINRGYICQKEA